MRIGLVTLLAMLTLTLRPQTAQALYGDEQCFKIFTKRAMLRKYDYKYMWGSSDTLTRGKEGTVQVTSKNSTQGTTAGIDPGITTGQFKVWSLSISSKKPCGFFAGNWARREEFIAASGDDVLRDIARGGGEHMHTVAILSGCRDGAVARLFEAARRDFDALQQQQLTSGSFSQELDSIIARDAALSLACPMS
jgi:hypothetical protein